MVRFGTRRVSTEYQDGSSSKTDDEKNCALVGKENKGKGKKSHSKSKTRKEGNKHDMSKVKCFNCHDYGHYATNCPQKKKNNKKVLGDAVGESLASHFELDFSLITCMVSNMMGSMWYLDSGASFHMTGNK